MSSPPASPVANANARALLAGASGLVGSLCLRKLLGGSSFAKVTAVARRPLGVADARLEVILTDLGQLAQVPAVPAGAALSALGTTIAKAGSQGAFRQVDHDGVVSFARWARQGGATTFVLVSSVGAAAGARSFYLRVKAETEDAVNELGFSRTVILRPSLLLGTRHDRRTGEAIAQTVLPPLNPLLLGPLRIYRAIAAETVAAAMVAAASASQPGKFVWHHDEIVAAAGAAHLGVAA